MVVVPCKWKMKVDIQVVPGRAGGGSFRRKKKYIAKKEFAYRMCARRPTSAMAVNEPSAVPWWWCDLFWCMSCHLMWWSCHLMRCDCLCCVMSRDAMRCHVMCAHVMCPAMVTLCVRSGSVTMWWSKVLFWTTKYYSVLQSTTPVLLCTTKYYSSTTLYYTVLQRTTPVLLCTTKYYSSTTQYYKVLLQNNSVLHSTTTYYSSTTLYYKVLLQYYSVLQSTKVLLQCYSVLQSTTPVLLSTTKYYSSTTLYYTVLQCTTPVLLCTTKYYSSTTLYCKVLLQYYSVLQSSIHDWSLTHMNRYLHCAEQQESSSNFTKYCTCHAKWLWWLIRVTYETSFTKRGATGVTIQLHQILRLPGKMNLKIHPHQIWNVIYNARSNRNHNPTSPNTAPATQSHSHDSRSSHMKRHLQSAEQHWFPSNITKYCACHEILSLRCQRKIPELLPPIERRSEDNPTMIRAWCDDISHPPLPRPYSSHLADAFCMEKYNTSRSGYLPKFHEMLRLPRKVTLHLHQILPLPRKMNLMIDPRHIWTVIYNARSNKHHTTSSPNTAPATQNESHDWSASHMKRHLQCAEQARSPSNLTKYCACHEICKFKISAETPWIASANRKTIRRHSDDNPTIIRR